MPNPHGGPDAAAGIAGTIAPLVVSDVECDTASSATASRDGLDLSLATEHPHLETIPNCSPDLLTITQSFMALHQALACIPDADFDLDPDCAPAETITTLAQPPAKDLLNELPHLRFNTEKLPYRC